MANYRVLLTGAAGFLGSHLCRSLAAQGYQVTGLVRAGSENRRLRSIAGAVEILAVDGCVGFSKLFDGKPFRAVIHTATNYGRELCGNSDLVRDNVMFPLQLLEALDKRGSRAVFVNTDSFFSKAGEESDYLRSYSTSKRQLLQWLSQQQSGRPMVNVRLEHLYGPDDSPGKFVPWLLTRLRSPEVIDLTDGTHRRDFIFVSDAVSAFLRVAEHIDAFPPGLTCFEIGTGCATTVREFVELAHAVSKSRAVLRFGSIPPRKGEIVLSRADTTAIRRLGWKPETSLTEGLRQCVSYSNRNANDAPKTLNCYSLPQ